MIEAFAINETRYTDDLLGSERWRSPGPPLRRLSKQVCTLADWLIAHGLSPDKADHLGRSLVSFATEEALLALGSPIRIGLSADALGARLRLVASLVWPEPFDPRAEGALARRLKSRFNQLTACDPRQPELRSSLHIVLFLGQGQSLDDYFRELARHEQESYFGILCKKARLPRHVTVSRSQD